MSDVTYHETRGKKTVEVDDCCFAHIEYEGGSYGPKIGLPDSIRYHAPICGELTNADVKAYANYLHGLFGVRGFTLKIKDGEAIWTIKTKGMAYAKALIRLTAFRYVSDIPDVVKKSLSSKQTLSKWFAKFQSEHVNDYKDCGESYYNAGHTLMSGTINPNLGVRAFRARLKNKSIKRVEAHFSC